MATLNDSNTPTVTLNWIDAADNESGFIIERAETFGPPEVPYDGPYTEIATVGSNVLTTEDGTLVARNTTYWYRVRAVNGSVGSAPAGPVAVWVPPALDIPTIGVNAGYDWLQLSLQSTGYWPADAMLEIELSSDGGQTFAYFDAASVSYETPAVVLERSGRYAGVNGGFRVRMVGGGQTSPYSDIAAIPYPLEAPWLSPGAVSFDVPMTWPKGMNHPSVYRIRAANGAAYSEYSNAATYYWPNTIRIEPANTTVAAEQSGLQFTALVVDGNGQAIQPTPYVNWYVDGGGTIDSDGYFTARTPGGPYVVWAYHAWYGGNTTFTVAGQVPTVAFVNPPQDSIVNGGGVVEVLIHATCPENGIAAVELFEGDTSLGFATIDNETPDTYFYLWTPSYDGNHTLTAFATSLTGRQASASVTVLSDAQPPVITVPENLTYEATGPDGALVEFPWAQAYDNATTNPVVTYSVPNPYQFPLGTTTVQVFATDLAGNTQTATFNVTVQDTTAPVITAPNMLVQVEDNEMITFDVFNASATDLVTVNPTLTYTPPFVTLMIGESAVIGVTATDAAGNESYGTFTITATLDDITPPIVEAQDVELEATSLAGAVLIEYPSFYIADNRSLYDDLTISFNPPLGSQLPFGTNQASVTAIDLAGNVTTRAFQIRVFDAPPVFTSSDYFHVEATSYDQMVVNYPPAEVYDRLTPNATITYSIPSGSLFSYGETEVYVKAVDASGNAAYQVLLVQVSDTIRPTITVPSDITVEADGPKGKKVGFSVTAWDNLTVNPKIDLTYPSGQYFPLGWTTVVATATDEAGHSITRSFKVIVEDNTPPTVTPPPNMTVNANSEGYAVVYYPPFIIKDDCSEELTVHYINGVPGFAFGIGNQPVSAIAYDKAGNMGVGTFFINVIGTTLVPGNWPIPPNENVTFDMKGPDGLVRLNNGDIDEDGVADFKDYTGYESGLNASAPFQKITLTIQAPTQATDFNRLSIGGYNVRLWMKDGGANRRFVPLDNGGDWVDFGYSFNTELLDVKSGTQTVVLYVEGLTVGKGLIYAKLVRSHLISGSYSYQTYQTTVIEKEVPIEVADLQFVDAGPNYQNHEDLGEGELKTTHIMSSQPFPTVNLNPPLVSITNQTMSITLSGQVKDALADNFPRDAGLDIASVKIFVDNDPTPVAETNVSSANDGAPTTWRQHPYIGNFAPITISVPARAGTRTVKVVTGANAAGKVGFHEYEIKVDQATSPLGTSMVYENIEFTSNSNTIRYWDGFQNSSAGYMGLSRDSANDPFVGEDYRKVRISVMGITDTTAQPRTLSVGIETEGPVSPVTSRNVLLREVQPGTNKFQASYPMPYFAPTNAYQVVSVLPGLKSGPGRIRPYKIRAKGLADFSDYCIEYMGFKFDLEAHDDGYYYAKGGSDQVFVYLDDESDPNNYLIIFYDTETRRHTVKTVPKATRDVGGKARLVSKTEAAKQITAKAQLIDFNLQTDINQDGVADALDDQLEKHARYMRPNDDVSNGTVDNANWDDDMAVFKVQFNNGGQKLGQVWFESDSGQRFSIYRDRKRTPWGAPGNTAVWDLEKGDSIPNALFFTLEGTGFAAQTDINLWLCYGKRNKIGNHEYWYTDKIIVRVVRELGDPDYFAGCRAYIMDNASSLFTDEKMYGNEPIRIVVMRQEKVLLTALETYHNKPELKGIDAVVAAHPEQTVIINGNFVGKVTGSTFGAGGQSTECVGQLISGGVLSPASDLQKGIGDYTPKDLGYIAQDPNGKIAFGLGLAQGSFKEVLGGLIPANRASNVVRDQKGSKGATQVVGEAAVGLTKVVFTLSTDYSKDNGGGGNGSVGSFDDAVASRGSMYIMDGSTSVALAYQDPAGTLITRCKGQKHDSGSAQYYINTYLMFKVKK